MSVRPLKFRARERGLVLVSSLLLLLVITILALAMFRSMGLAERIAGNVREKQRALHAAVVAEQYAEFWLSSPGSIAAASTCSATANGNIPSNILICNVALDNPTTLPWTAGGSPVGFTYAPQTGVAATTMNFVADGTGSYVNTYVYTPSFYVQYIGLSADGSGGSVYKIDAVGYGGGPLSVAVVESTYEIGSQTRDPTQL